MSNSPSGENGVGGGGCGSDADIPAFAELVAATNYSFLHGASHPSDMIARAIALKLKAIGIADRNTVAGVVRAFVAHRDAPEKARNALLHRKRRQEGEKAELTEAEKESCDTGLELLVGARLVFADGTPDIVAYPATRKGWGRLTRLLTVGNLRSVKGGCILRFNDLLNYIDDLQLIVLPASTYAEQQAHPDPVAYQFDDNPDPEPRSHLTLVPPASPRELTDLLIQLRQHSGGNVWLGLSISRRGDDIRRLTGLQAIAMATRVPVIATNDALYAAPQQRPLHDVLTCIREGVTIRMSGRRLEANAERHLRSPQDMARLFARFPEAIREGLRFMSTISFRLTDLRYEYPHEPVPEGWEPQAWLEHLVTQAAHKRYGVPLPDKVVDLMTEEFTLIARRNYAYYFLTVHDLVRFARAQDPPILCQGRGSAANSIVCFLLGVTSVDPMQHDLLFSRFVSEDRNEPPDIDVDFEHERREEVMQYVYRRYGRHRAGIAATVIHYRSRSAVREVAKALGMGEDIAIRLSGTVWGSYSGDMEDRRVSEAGFDLANPEIMRLRAILDQLLEAPFPRHLSQHVGGFVLTQNRLDETVPLHHAAMQDRSFIEWDKDDIDALGLMKVDVLALGMLSCIRKAFNLMRDNELGDNRLEIDIASDDPVVYDMLKTGDSIGVFQVESRAQINMLPRLRPKNLYDLTVQVAIVRPGPIEGDMVHPYLRRRNGEEKVEYPRPALPHDQNELRSLLGETYGVPLFQEQAMKLAITAAGFTPSEANQLRRAMATFRNVGTIHRFRDMMVDGMVARGYEKDFAERCYRQIEGFGSYGFPESHALSFARLVYISAWIKCHYPAIFACAILNSQPMGFYAPAQLVRDAREHGVEVRDVDVNASGWNNELEKADVKTMSEDVAVIGAVPPARFAWDHATARRDGMFALRLGFRQIDGFREGWADTLTQARMQASFTSIEDMARRAHLPARALRMLADADACRSLGKERRQALWEARRTPSEELPLFAAARASELGQEADAFLPVMPPAEQVMADYQMTRLSLKGHPMQFLRSRFLTDGVLSCAETAMAKNGTEVRTAGVVLVRQRPGKGNAIFITLEDETGITNVLLWARLFETQRRPVMASRLMVAEGVVQRSKEGVVHLMATRIHDYTHVLDGLSHTQDHEARMEEVHGARMHGHPRNVRILPKSRDFH